MVILYIKYGDKMEIKVMTFNTQHCENFISKKIDYDAVVNLIKKYDADIIGLNEIFGKGFDKNIKDSQVREIAEKLGYYYYFAKATRINFRKYGNAIISKYPLIDPKVIKIPTNLVKKTGKKLREKRCILKTDIDIDGGLTVCIGHFGLNDDEVISGIATAYKIFQNHRFILMGDFNTPNSSTFLDPIRENLNDTILWGDGKTNTFPSDNPSIRYDYIFTSKDINIINTIIPDDIVSDHRPIVSTLELLKHYDL